MEKFEVVRKGWKHDTVVSEFDSVEEARTYREQQSSNKNLYVRPVERRCAEQFLTTLADMGRRRGKVKRKRGTKRIMKYFLVDYNALKLIGEYASEDAVLRAKKSFKRVDARYVAAPEDIESTFTFDQRVDLYRNLGGTSKVLQRGELHHLIFNLLDKEYDMTTKKATTKSKVTKKAVKGKAAKKAVKGKAGKKAAKGKGNGAQRTGSCAKVYEICEGLYRKDEEAPRAAYIAACIKAGIKKSTAATIYQRWKVANFG